MYRNYVILIVTFITPHNLINDKGFVDKILNLKNVGLLGHAAM